MGGSNEKLMQEKSAREEAERQVQQLIHEKKVRDAELEGLRKEKRERIAKDQQEEELAKCKKKREEIKSLLKKGGNENKKPVNVLVVGLPGSGKSSLITSMECCVTLKFGEVAVSGEVEGAESLTHILRRHKLFKGDANLSDCRADFYDMPGLQNNRDEKSKSRMRAILKGQMNVNNLNSAQFNNLSIDDNTTIESNESKKIDRMIFVHSCTVDNPENLTKIVMELSRELDIVVFSVLSHIDQEERSSLEELELAVGTKGSPRSVALELFHKQHAHIGNIEEAFESNNMLYQLWEAILNQNYTIHSNKNVK